jgi:hypothetical protein
MAQANISTGRSFSSSSSVSSLDADRLSHRLGQLVTIPSVAGREKEALLLIKGFLLDIQSKYDAPSAADGHPRIQVEYLVDSMQQLAKQPHFPGLEVPRSEVPLILARIRGDSPGTRANCSRVRVDACWEGAFVVADPSASHPAVCLPRSTRLLVLCSSEAHVHSSFCSLFAMH